MGGREPNCPESLEKILQNGHRQRECSGDSAMIWDGFSIETGVAPGATCILHISHRRSHKKISKRQRVDGSVKSSLCNNVLATLSNCLLLHTVVGGCCSVVFVVGRVAFYFISCFCTLL